MDMIFALAKRDPRIVYIGSDLSPDLTERMKREMPGRAYMEGVSEAHVIGMAAGLAMEGYIPYVHTIATFITRRCYEQVALDLCLHNLPVRLIGNGGGLVYAPLGPTHLAIEDLAIMRALPNMASVACCDADEMRRLMPQTVDWPGPIYIRLAKGGDPVVSSDKRGFSLGKAILMRDVSSDGRSVLLLSTGIATTRALQAAETLAAEGIQCRVLHLHTIKPLDNEAIIHYSKGVALIVTIEEHTVVGGLGSAVTDALVEYATDLPTIKRLGINDVFATRYGTQDELMRMYGIAPAEIAQAVRESLNTMN